MTIIDDKTNRIIQDILAELTRAEHLHPVWPGVGYRGDHVRAVAKLAEETGEAVQAANNLDEGKGGVGHIRRELVQVGAMVLRCLINLDEVERRRINESARQDLQEEHNIYVNGVYPTKAEGLVLADYTEGTGL